MCHMWLMVWVESEVMVYALDLCAFGISFAHRVSNMGRTCTLMQKKRMDRNGSKVMVGMARMYSAINTNYSLSKQQKFT